MLAAGIAVVFALMRGSNKMRVAFAVITPVVLGLALTFFPAACWIATVLPLKIQTNGPRRRPPLT